MQASILPTIKAVASTLVQEVAQDDPAIVAAFLFPSDTEIRLVYIDTTARPSPDPKRIVPFYFGADAEGRVPYPSAVALLRPEDKATLQPPDEWGTWRDAFSLPFRRNGE
jgi:hypothetical protein